MQSNLGKYIGAQGNRSGLSLCFSTHALVHEGFLNSAMGMGY